MKNKEILNCSNTIKSLMDEIASSSKFQYNMTVTVNKRVNDISQVVQTNSDAVEQSVFTSKALSNQAAILNELINRFQIK